MHTHRYTHIYVCEDLNLNPGLTLNLNPQTVGNSQTHTRARTHTLAHTHNTDKYHTSEILSFQTDGNVLRIEILVWDKASLACVSPLLWCGNFERREAVRSPRLSEPQAGCWLQPLLSQSQIGCWSSPPPPSDFWNLWKCLYLLLLLFSVQQKAVQCLQTYTRRVIRAFSFWQMFNFLLCPRSSRRSLFNPVLSAAVSFSICSRWSAKAADSWSRSGHKLFTW